MPRTLVSHTRRRRTAHGPSARHIFVILVAATTVGIVAHQLHVLSAVIRRHVLEDLLIEDAALAEKRFGGFDKVVLYIITLEAVAGSKVIVASESFVCGVVVVVQIGSPNQGAREAHIIGPLLFLSESVCVVVRDPLICIPCDVFNCCLFVVMHRDISFLAVLVENVLDFVVGEIATRSRAGALLCAALHHTMVSRTNS